MKTNRILVIEDAPDIRKLIRLTLENGVRDVIEAQTAEDGLALMDAVSFDIMLIDIGLSGSTNGLAVAEQALEHPRQHVSQVAIVTGSDAPEHIRMAKELGVAAYLMKPFSPEKLSAIVAKMESRIADTLVVPPDSEHGSPNTFDELKASWPMLFF